MQEIFESIFDISYILFALIMGAIMCARSKKNKVVLLFGIMTLVLVFGDMFHLIPRVVSFWSETSDQHIVMLGYGKMMTSITMTVFYMLLYVIWRNHYSITKNQTITVLLIALSIIRVCLCFSPENEWAIENSNYIWGIYRNIPFLMIGIIMIYLFFITRNEIKNDSLKYMWIAILLSFLFYLPVIILAQFWTAVGMFMLPKTIAYVWMIIMGYKMIEERR